MENKIDLRQKIAHGELSWVFSYLVSDIQKKAINRRLSSKEEQVYVQNARFEKLSESYLSGALPHESFMRDYLMIAQWLLRYVNRNIPES